MVSRVPVSNGSAPVGAVGFAALMTSSQHRFKAGKRWHQYLLRHLHTHPSLQPTLPKTFLILGIMFLLSTSGMPVSHHSVHVLTESLLGRNVIV